MKMIVALAFLASTTALASVNETPVTKAGYVHAASTKVSKGKDKELTVKEGAGFVTTGSYKPSLSERKSKN